MKDIQLSIHRHRFVRNFASKPKVADLGLRHARPSQQQEESSKDPKMIGQWDAAIALQEMINLHR